MNKCDIHGLKANLPETFDPWSSRSEALLTKFGCSMQPVPQKNGVPILVIGNIQSMMFEALGYLKSSNEYDEESDTTITTYGKVVPYKRKNIVINGINGTASMIPHDNLAKIVKNLQNVSSD